MAADRSKVRFGGVHGSIRVEDAMADNDNDAALERAARRIFELQNPGKPWPPGPLASAEEKERYRQLARKEHGSKEG